jgi:dihydroneopterin aldolase
MKTDKIFVVPQVTVEDYAPDGEHGFSEPKLYSLKTDAMKARLKLVRELKLQYPQFYASLIQLLTAKSRDLVERHTDFAANNLVEDPNVIWDLILFTHQTNATGGGVMSTLFNKVTMTISTACKGSLG